MRIFTIILSLAIVSCNSVYYSEHNMAGIYIGGVKDSRKGLGEADYLYLKEDGSCKIVQRHDIYMSDGFGRWEIIGKEIIMEFENRVYEDANEELLDALSGGSIIKGKKSAQIINRNKIKLKYVNLDLEKERIISLKRIQNIDSIRLPFILFK